MKKLIRKVLFLFVISTMISCDLEIDEKEIIKTKEFILELKTAMDAEEYSKLSYYYSPIFFKDLTEEAYIEELKIVKSKLGNYKSCNLKSIDFMEVTDIDETRNMNVVVLLFDFEYENFKTEERFTIEKDKNTYKIHSHHYDSEAF